MTLRKKKSEYTNLRCFAEKRLLEKGEVLAYLINPSDTSRLLHELQVHQIELEILNEECGRARAEAEDALSKYSDLYNFAPIAYMTITVDGVIRSVNLLAAALFERTRPELNGKRLGILVAEENRTSLNAFLARVFVGETNTSCEVMVPQEGMPPRVVRIAATVAPLGEECRLILIDITQSRTDETMLRGVCDELETLVAQRTSDLAEMNLRLQEDISQRQLVEAALRKSEERLRHLLSATSTFFCRFKIENGLPLFIEHGAGCEDVTGYTPEDYDADPSLWISMIPQDDQAAVLGAIQRITKTNAPIWIQHPIVCKNGETRWIHNMLVPHHDRSGTMSHCDVVVTDITERKEHEEERFRLEREARRGEELRYLGQLTAGVAHEVRSPLNAISITIEILATQLQDVPEYARNIKRIRRQVNRLDQLMKDLLHLRRPEDSRNSQPCAPASICRMAINIWKESNRSTTCRINTEFSAEAESQRIMVDQERMIQVLVNLLNNAMQHSPDGSEIHVSATQSEEDGARIRVCDQGTGFSKTGLGQAFDPFFTTRREGSGLGLSITKHIVEIYSGTIHIHNNTPPPGCTAEIHLPVIPSANAFPTLRVEGEVSNTGE